MPSDDGPPPFVLVDNFVMTSGPGAIPTCTGDPDCVMQCRVSTGPAWACFDNAGAAVSGVTQGTSTTYVDTFARGTLALNDVSDTTAPFIVSSALRSLITGNYTVIGAGYGTTANGSGFEEWWAQYDGSHEMQGYSSGGAWVCSDGNGSQAATTANSAARDGWSVVACMRSGTTITAIMQGDLANQGTKTQAASSAVTSGNFYFGRFTSTGTAMRGPLGWVNFYSVAKGGTWIQQKSWDWYGAKNIVTNQSNVPQLLGREGDGGFVDMFAPKAIITDATLGQKSQKTFKNYWAADPLAAATWTDVGTPTVTSNASSGPFSRWKNAAECDLIVDDDGSNFEGKRSASAAAAGNGWYNATCYLKAGTSGTTTTAARIRINTDGTVDAGSVTCDVTGLSSSAARYPTGNGCFAWIDAATTVTADVLVGNGTSTTGSITTCQCQLTPTLYPESPTVDNGVKGNGWVQLDAGSWPSGPGLKGKVEVVFQHPWDSTPLVHLAGHGITSFVLDAFSTVPQHVVTMEATGLSNLPDLIGLMYGPLTNQENKFDVTGAGSTVLSFTWYVMSMEWRPSGTGCVAKFRFDRCADPATCHATTIIAQNTGAAGECPDVMVAANLGQRYDGTDPSSIWVPAVRVYR